VDRAARQPARRLAGLLALFSLVAFRRHGSPADVSGIFVAFILPFALLGPAAGVLVDRWNPRATMIASDLLRAVLALLLAVAATLPQLRPATGAPSVLAELAQGLRFVASRPAIVFVIVTTVAAIVAAGVFDALIAIYVRDILFAGSRAFGALVSIVGAGTIAGAFLVGRFGQGVPRVRLVALGIVGVGVAILGIAASARLEPALAASLGLGLAAAAVFIPSQTLLQEETPPAMLGRVSATFTTTITVAQLLGILGAGRLADLAGIRRLYYGVSAIMFSVGLAGYAWVRGWRPADPRPAETAR
jgi:MFS family permease